ncbi:MAG: hemolysin family protein [Planctomycetota bacterium]
MLSLLLLSAFFSGSETALFSLSKVSLNKLMDANSLTSRSILRLNEERSEFLSTVLFCNMLVNIMFFSKSATFIADFGSAYGHTAMLLLSLCSLFLVIIFGEVTPKSLAVISPEKFLSFSAVPMHFLHKIVSPIRFVLRRIIKLIEILLSNNSDDKEEHRNELRMLLQTAADKGELSKIESLLIGELIDFSDIKVKEFMTHRVDIVVAEADKTAEEIIELAREKGISRIPLYAESRDNIKGVVNASELFLNKEKGSFDKYITPAHYVTEYQRADMTLKYFLKHKINLAIVLDEYGGTTGVVTYSDIMEEIFGEGAIDEDGFSGPHNVEKVDENKYIVSGRLSLRDWKNLLDYSEELPSVDTVGGLVTSLLGKFPEKGDSIEIGWIKMTVRKVFKKQIVSLTLEITEENDKEN